MRTRTPDQVLDEIAREGIGAEFSLSSGLKARIRKENQNRMKRRNILIGATVFIVVVIGLFSIPSVAQAVKKLFGYIPGSGFIEQSTPIRVLKEPVTLEVGGISITVSQAVADSEHTSIAYKLEHIPDTSDINADLEGYCRALPAIKLADGTILDPKTISGNFWASGLSRQLEYGAIPADEKLVSLIFSCIESAPLSAETSNVSLVLEFENAPDDLKVYPVVELPTPDITETSSVEPTNPASPISLSIIKYVQTDTDLIFLGVLQSDSTDFRLSFVESGAVHLTDSAGNSIPIEEDTSITDPVAGDAGGNALPLTYHTAGAYAPGLATLTIDEVWVDFPGGQEFSFDTGSSPQPGQTWPIGQSLDLNGNKVTIIDAAEGQDGKSLDLNFEAPKNISNLLLCDSEHDILGGGGGDINTGFTYKENFPSGRLNLYVCGFTQKISGPWQAKIDIPATIGKTTPTAIPEACLTNASWQTALQNASAVLPDGLGTRMLLADTPAPEYLYHVLLASIPDLGTEDLGKAYSGSFSPDGKKVALGTDEGLKIITLKDHQQILVADTTRRDMNPVWSPDGTEIAFTRGPIAGMMGGAGPYQLMLVDADGTGLRTLLADGAANYAQSWIPGSDLLIFTVKTEQGSTIKSINSVTGEIEMLTEVNYQNTDVAVSPDGKKIAYETMLPGEKYSIWVSDLDGSNARLVSNADPIVTTVPQWSPDGQWLAISVYDTSLNENAATISLVNLTTCQVILITELHGSVNSWQ
jgi:hypothetical protein